MPTHEQYGLLLKIVREIRAECDDGVEEILRNKVREAMLQGPATGNENVELLRIAVRTGLGVELTKAITKDMVADGELCAVSPGQFALYANLDG